MENKLLIQQTVDTIQERKRLERRVCDLEQSVRTIRKQFDAHVLTSACNRQVTVWHKQLEASIESASPFQRLVWGITDAFRCAFGERLGNWLCAFAFVGIPLIMLICGIDCAIDSAEIRGLLQ